MYIVVFVVMAHCNFAGVNEFTAYSHGSSLVDHDTPGSYVRMYTHTYVSNIICLHSCTYVTRFVKIPLIMYIYYYLSLLICCKLFLRF